MVDFPIQAVVEEAVGEVEEKITVQGSVDLFHVHVVEEEAVEDCFTDLIGVTGIGVDAVDLGSEGGTAVARGYIFRGGAVEDDDGVIGNAADGSLMEPFAVARPSAVGTRGSFGSIAPVEMDGLGAWRLLGILVLGIGMG